LEHRASNPVSVKNLTATETSTIVKLLRPYVPVGTKRTRSSKMGGNMCKIISRNICTAESTTESRSANSHTFHKDMEKRNTYQLKVAAEALNRRRRRFILRFTIYHPLRRVKAVWLEVRMRLRHMECTE
jgi:hypothetical protein